MSISSIKYPRIFLTGGSGMLGEAFLRLYPPQSLFAIARTTDNSRIISGDISDISTMKDYIEQFKPDCIIHAAAITNLEYCHTHQREAHKINVEATKK